MQRCFDFGVEKAKIIETTSVVILYLEMQKTRPDPDCECFSQSIIESTNAQEHVIVARGKHYAEKARK